MAEWQVDLSGKPKPTTGVVWKIGFSLAGIWIIAQMLGIGAIAGITSLFASPLFLIVLILFIIIWATRK